MQSKSIPTARRAGIFQENLGDEVVLYDQEAQRVHRLNRTMALVWEAANGQRSLADIASLLSVQTGCSCDGDMALVALRQLEREGLLEAPPASEEVLPSRRELGKKFATAGISISLLPVIASMMAPTPAMARSVDASLAAYGHQLRTAQADIASNSQSFAKNAAAKQDYKAALDQGGKGTVEYLKGDFNSANQDFKSGESDLDSMLQALGF